MGNGPFRPDPPPPCEVCAKRATRERWSLTLLGVARYVGGLLLGIALTAAVLLGLWKTQGCMTSACDATERRNDFYEACYAECLANGTSEYTTVHMRCFCGESPHVTEVEVPERSCAGMPSDQRGSHE